MEYQNIVNLLGSTPNQPSNLGLEVGLVKLNLKLQ